MTAELSKRSNDSAVEARTRKRRHYLERCGWVREEPGHGSSSCRVSPGKRKYTNSSTQVGLVRDFKLFFIHHATRANLQDGAQLLKQGGCVPGVEDTHGFDLLNVAALQKLCSAED